MEPRPRSLLFMLEKSTKTPEIIYETRLQLNRSRYREKSLKHTSISGADPGFLQGRQPIIWPDFPENYMKMNKIGSGGASKICLCRSATEFKNKLNIKHVFVTKCTPTKTERYRV